MMNVYFCILIVICWQAIYRGGERERPYSSGGAPPPPAEPATRTVTMSRDPADSHGFGICVKGGKEAGGNLPCITEHLSVDTLVTQTANT